MASTGRASTTIAARPEVVFARITDLGGLPEWNAAMTRVEVVPERLAPGAQWVVEFRALGQVWHSRAACEVFEPGEGRFSYRSGTDDGNPSFARWRWRVTPVGGATAVEVDWELHPATFWRRVLLARVRARQLVKEVRASLDALAHVVAAAGSAR